MHVEERKEGKRGMDLVWKIDSTLFYYDLYFKLNSHNSENSNGPYHYQSIDHHPIACCCLIAFKHDCIYTWNLVAWWCQWKWKARSCFLSWYASFWCVCYFRYRWPFTSQRHCQSKYILIKCSQVILIFIYFILISLLSIHKHIWTHV